MKTLFFIPLFFLFMGSILSQTIRSAIVEYDVDHYGVKHKQILYVDDFGKKKVIDVYNPNNTTKRYLSLDGMDYTFMLESKNLNFKYPSIKNDVIYHVYDMNTLTDEKYFVSAEKTGTRVILDKECNVYTIHTADNQESTYFIWEGILLKKISKSSNLEAVKIIESPEFEPGQFEIPEGYIFR